MFTSFFFFVLGQNTNIILYVARKIIWVGYIPVLVYYVRTMITDIIKIKFQKMSIRWYRR